MSGLHGKTSRTQLTGKEKRMIYDCSPKKVKTGQSEDKIAAWFKAKAAKKIHRLVVGKCVRVFPTHCRLRASSIPRTDEKINFVCGTYAFGDN